MPTWSNNKLTHWEFAREVHWEFAREVHWEFVREVHWEFWRKVSWEFAREVSWEFASVVLRIRAQSRLAHNRYTDCQYLFYAFQYDISRFSMHFTRFTSRVWWLAHLNICLSFSVPLAMKVWIIQHTAPHTKTVNKNLNVFTQQWTDANDRK